MTVTAAQIRTTLVWFLAPHIPTKQEGRKWLPVKLLHTTMDQDAWEVQWYNTHDKGDMLTARYYPAWEKPNGDEIYCANAKKGYKPLQWCVYKGRLA